MMTWTGAHCAFAVEMLFKTGEFVIATQRAFCVHSMLRQNDAVLYKKKSQYCWCNMKSAGKNQCNTYRFTSLKNISTANV